MALQTRISKKQWILLQNLGNGATEWEDLPFEDKYRVYETGINIKDTVDPEKVREFEEELQSRRQAEELGTIEGIINSFTRRLPR